MSWRRVSRSVLVATALAAAACVPTTSRSRQQQLRSGGDLIWPQPPHRPRVRFVQVLASARDLGIRPSFWRRFGELFVGKREERFVRPTGVAARGSTIYVADPGAQALWILNREAGRWQAVRQGNGTPLVSPVAVACGPPGLVYLADSYLAQVFAYRANGKLDHALAGESFRRPVGLAYDATRDRLYVADSAAHVIWVFGRDGTPAGAIGRRGSTPGEFNFPTHVAVDRDGTLYVTDALNFRVQIFAPDGSFVGQIGRHGDSAGEFAGPKGVAADSEAHIYVVETLFDAVQIFEHSGRYLLTFGRRGTGRGEFWLPSGLFIDDRDRIYVADAYNQRIQIFQYLASGENE